MDEKEALSRIESALEGIAADNNAGIQRHTLDDGLRVWAIENEEKMVRAEGYSDLEVASHLQGKAKDEGWA